MFNQHYKHKNIKLKHTKMLKQLSSVLLATLLIATSLPISNVHAYDSLGTLTGDTSGTTSGSGEEYDTSNNIGSISGENVRCYIYNKQTGKFIQGTYDGTTFDAIDFAGATNASWNLYSQADSCSKISHDTAFGTAGSIHHVNDWPFKIKDDDGNYKDKYFCYITFEANTDSDEICEWLKADNAENLSKLVETYWGTEVLSQLRRDPNLMFCTEPLMVVSSINDEGSLVSRKEITNTCWEEQYFAIYEEDVVENDELKKYDDSFNDEGSYKEERSDGKTLTVDTVNGNDEGLIKALASEYTKRGYSEERAEELAKDQIKDIEDAINSGFKYFIKKRTEWEDVTYVEQHYDYICATGRYIKQNTGKMKSRGYESGSIETSELGIPKYYNVPEWLCNAVFTDGIGEGYRYNDEYNIVFSEGNRDSKGHPTFNGEPDILKIGDDGTMTSYGISIFAPGASGCIWHTNDYTKNYPSPVPPAAAAGGPNESLAYGNNTVVKIYETRDRNTGKLTDCISCCSATDAEYGCGIPDVISIEDESQLEVQDKWISETVNVLGTEVTRTWVKWMKNNNPEENGKKKFVFDEETGEVQALGSGYIVADWCTGNRSYEDAINLSAADSSNNGGYAYETKDLVKFNQGKGEAFVTLGGSDENGGAVDENILYVRLVKYTDNSQETLDINNIYGEVWLLKSNDINFPAESTSKELVLERCLRNNYGR